jgi:cytochrome P450
MMELIKDQSLLHEVRQEVQSAFSVDTQGVRQLDIQKVVHLPLLQSVFTETLRLHMSIHITREVMKPTQINGFNLRLGSLVQAPTQIAHYDEASWGVDGHPASEFWGARHVKEAEGVDESGQRVHKREFAIAAPSGSYFPFGEDTPFSAVF